MAEVTPDPIMRIALGFMAAKHLFVASAIGVFEKLADGPATVDELAANCGIPSRTLRISADAMVSVGLLEREGDRYCNSAAGWNPSMPFRFWTKTKCRSGKLPLGKRVTSRPLRDATDRSYHFNLETRRGRPARIVLGDRMPEMVQLLPEPVELGA